MRKARASAAACWGPRHLRARQHRGRSRPHRSPRHSTGRRPPPLRHRNRSIPRSTREQENAAAYIELHIEQGPVLERMGLPLGVVLGTKGVERHAITFHGQEAHSGSTPMNARRDALAAAAKLALEIRPIATKHPTPFAPWAASRPFPASSPRSWAVAKPRWISAIWMRPCSPPCTAKRAKRVSASPAKSAARWNGRASGASSPSRFIPI